MEWNEEDSKILEILARGAANGTTLSEVFHQTLEEGSRFAASDPRDHVYAICGMIRERGGCMDVDNFPIDYSKLVSEAYQEVIRFSLLSMYQSQHIDFPNRYTALRALWQYEVQLNRECDIPSWAID